MRERGAEAAARWRGLVSEQVESKERGGVSVASAGCQRRSCFLGRSAFGEVGSSSATFVEVAVSPAPENPSMPATCGRGIEVRLRGDRTLIVKPGFDVSHLQALLMALESRA
jgi:hypothetical protein